MVMHAKTRVFALRDGPGGQMKREVHEADGDMNRSEAATGW